MNWYQLNIKESLEETSSQITGLSAKERTERLERNGLNQLTPPKKKNKLLKFLSYFNDLLIYVLIFAAVFKFLDGYWLYQFSGGEADYFSGPIILLVILINAFIGYFQERKALQSLNAITSILADDSTIYEDGVRKKVLSRELVVGDIVYLTPGSIIPADLRIIESFGLVVDEAILTGESLPVSKELEALTGEVGLGDRLNMLYSGTMVNSGTGKGVVVEVGENTELGKISNNLKQVRENKTPLLVKIHKLSKQIFVAVIILAILLSVFMFVLPYNGIYVGNINGWTQVLTSVIIIAVSTVPEALPAVISIILSLGVGGMAKQNAIIKKMPTIETLGSMSVVCSDKTGTLTKNEMTLMSLVTTNHSLKEKVNRELVGKLLKPENQKIYETLIKVAAYCHDTKILYKKDKKEIIGSPTEGALIETANQVIEEVEHHIHSKIPFDSSYKYMAILVDYEGELWIVQKGAPDVLLASAKYQDDNGRAQPINQKFWEDSIDELARMGQRVLAASVKKVPNNLEEFSHEALVRDMVFCGLFGIIDPPKEEAIVAVHDCLSAGVNVKMITGDHKETAIAIAREIGILNPENALTGKDIEALTDDELVALVSDCNVYARTTPEHKLRLVSAIQNNGHIVGMTGDGVNDAPALKKADIGIAMGIKGTEVTKEAADMVLADDNFATIAKSIKEGRRVFDNIMKTIYFMLPTAFAQGLIIVFSILFGLELHLTPIHVLWINMVTTITLSFALGFEKADNDIMRRNPKNPNEGILNKYSLVRTVYVTLLIAGLGLLLNWQMGALLSVDGSISEVDTRVLNTTLIQLIVVCQLAYMINCRKVFKFAIDKTMLTNKVLWISIGALLLLQAILIYVPFMNSGLNTAMLNITHLGISSLGGVIVFVIVELEKLVTRTIRRKKDLPLF